VYDAGDAPRVVGGAAGRDIVNSYSGMRMLVMAALLALGGCSLNRLVVDRVGDAISQGGASFSGDDDPELIQAAAPFSLKLIEGLLAEDPGHQGLLLAAARGFTQYSYAFVQQEADETEVRDASAARAMRLRARGLYSRARGYGLRALEAAHPEFRAQLEANPARALAALGRDDAPRLYWTTVAWAAAISLSKDSAEALADLRPLDLMVGRLQDLDPDMDHGALHAFLIAYEMGRPGARHPEELARSHFERAVRLSASQNAGPFVAFAESVCVAARNRREFLTMLGRAAAIDPSARPEWRLENAVMQRRARWLLARVDELFLE
jgi:predicted anti-sigma-YlaC factor YlaD